MKANVKKDIMLGLYVAVGLLLFIGVVYFIGSRQSLFGSSIKIHAIFNDVSGLQSGNNVRLSGIKIGTVESVDIISDSSVNVTMLIDKSSSQFVKKDAFAAIESNGLMGNKVVSISPGSVQARQIQDGDEIRTEQSSRLR